MLLLCVATGLCHRNVDIDNPKSARGTTAVAGDDVDVDRDRSLSCCSWFLRGTDEIADVAVGAELEKTVVPKGVMEPALCSFSCCLVARIGSSSEADAYCLESGQRQATSSGSTANPTHDSLVANGVLVVDSGLSSVINDKYVAPPGLHLSSITHYNNHHYECDNH